MKMKQNQQQATYLALRLFIGVVFILLLNSCEKDKKDPALETTSITALSASNYHVTANISEKGDYKILDYGFVFTVGTSFENGYVYNNKVSLGSTIVQDTFSTTIKLGDLQYYYGSGVKVFAKAYITNERGTLYAKEVSTDLLKLQITTITPSTAKLGDTITLYGKGFSTPASENIVKFNNVNATVQEAGSTYLKVIVPLEIPYNYYGSSVTIYISSGGQTFQLDNALTLTASAVSFSPTSGNWNTYITVRGWNLYNSTLYFDDVQVYSNNSSYDYISATIPNSFLKKRFKIFIGSGGTKTEVPGGYFTMDELVVNPLTVTSYAPGSQITFYSSGFNPTVSYNKLFLGSTTITSTNSYYYSDLSFTIPSTMSEGNYLVMLSNGADTAFTGQTISIFKPVVTGFTPASGYPGSELVINGTNLLAGNQYTYVNFGTASVSPNSITSEKIKVNVPFLTAGQYDIDVYLGGLVLHSPEKFTVLEPKLTSINPSSGTAGSSVILNGEGFGGVNITSVTFGNLYATVMSSTNTQINVKVPSGITKGVWIVKVVYNYYYELSTTVTFTVP
ncbi:MAG: IPT/TIG domain-containing protein [Lentimicrobiaceae bacterium]|jgi:hypothetical protein